LRGVGVSWAELELADRERARADELDRLRAGVSGWRAFGLSWLAFALLLGWQLIRCTG
jgi:hypothetical protein